MKRTSVREGREGFAKDAKDAHEIDLRIPFATFA
jgi:hypothetical protein